MADASLVFDIDSSQAVGAAKALAALNRYAAATATVNAKMERQYRASNGQFGSQVELVARNETAIRRLADSYNPVLSAQLRFAEAQKDVAHAVQLGVITSDQQAAILSRLSSDYAKAAASSRGFGAQQQISAAHTGNVFAQLNDIGVMLAAGQNPLQLALQQGTQLNQVWGQMGGTFSSAGGALKSAFMSMLSPINLVTIGVIAGGAALVQWGMSAFGASDSTRRFADRVSDAESAISRINSASESLTNGGLQKVAEKYGVINSEILALIENERKLAMAEGVKSLKVALEGITETLGDGWFSTAYGEIERVFGVGANEAQVLYGVLQNIGKEKGLDRQLQTIQTMTARLSDATDGFKNMTDEQADMLSKLTSAESLVRQLLASSKGLPGAFRAAADAAAAITNELQRAVQAASRLAASAISDARFAQIELDFRTDPIAKAAAIAAAKFDEEVGKAGMDQWLYNSLRDQAIKGAKETARIMGEVERLNAADAAAARSGGGGGGGGGAAAIRQAEKQFQSLRELLEGETMFQYAEYEKRQAQLVAALDKQVITEQQYAQMSQDLKTYYFGMDYDRRALEYEMSLDQLRQALEMEYITRQEYNARTAALQWEYTNAALDLNSTTLGAHLNGLSDYFGQANSLAGGGYASLLKAQKTFAAASAFVAAYQGASLALTDQNLTTWQRIAAAAKVLTTGLGFVSAIKSGGGAGGGGSARSAATSTAPASAPAQAEKTTIIRLSGDGYFTDFVGGLMEEIYKQSKDGRVIIAGYNT